MLMGRRLRVLAAAGTLALLAGVQHARAESLIPWPWLESSRYSAWKQERDSARADWYARRALDPVGARQRYYKGKMWPPFPRPEGLSMLPTHRYHAAHYWPYPYYCDDRQVVRDIVAVQEDAGWTDATTVYEYHFDADTQELNRAGRIHVRWVMQTAPVDRRVLYVQTGLNAVDTELRLASVRNAATEMVGGASAPPVIPRVTQPLGRSALEVDLIQRADQKTMPAPRISAPISGSGSGSSAGSSGM